MHHYYNHSQRRKQRDSSRSPKRWKTMPTDKGCTTPLSLFPFQPHHHCIMPGVSYINAAAAAYKLVTLLDNHFFSDASRPVIKKRGMKATTNRHFCHQEPPVPSSTMKCFVAGFKIPPSDDNALTTSTFPVPCCYWREESRCFATEVLRPVVSSERGVCCHFRGISAEYLRIKAFGYGRRLIITATTVAASPESINGSVTATRGTATVASSR